MLIDHSERSKQRAELDYFRIVKRDLEPKRLLDHFEKTHGLVRDHYKTYKVKGGGSRIKIGNRAYTLNDFCTQHMRLNWHDTKEVLSYHYKRQRAEREASRVVNSISFSSRYVTQGYLNKDKLARLNESMMILKFLQKQERQGQTMPLPDLEKFRSKTGLTEKNAISNGDLSLSSVADNFKRQQLIASQLESTFSISNLVANKDIKNQKINFVDKSTGEKSFSDYGDKLIMDKRKPEITDIAAAMTLAAEKFGVINITGTKEFKQQVIDVAVTSNLSIVFSDKKMEAQFLKQKSDYSASKLEQTPKEELKTQPQVAPPSASAEPAPVASEPTVLLKHGTAPYLHDKENKPSYFAELSNGETLWGVGLKDAIAASKAAIGDQVNISRVGDKDVVVPIDIKGENGEVVRVDQKDAKRTEWEVLVTPKDAVKQGPEALKTTPKKETGFDVNYKWSKEESKMIVTINGSKPADLAPEKLAKIVSKDPFLQKYSIDALKSGSLDLSTAKGVQPIPRKFNSQGDVVAASPAVKAPKLT